MAGSFLFIFYNVLNQCVTVLRLAIGDTQLIKTMDKSCLVIDYVCLIIMYTKKKLFDCAILTFVFPFFFKFSKEHTVLVSYNCILCT